MIFWRARSVYIVLMEKFLEKVLLEDLEGNECVAVRLILGK
jgi:hypothetical protein